MIRAVMRLASGSALLLTMQLLWIPIWAHKKPSHVDEFMVENQRTRMRQNYVLQRPLNKDTDSDNIGVTYVTEPLDPNTSLEELPALIVDYANMIRNDIILLDNSIETRTRKRGNINVKKFDQGEISDISCSCEQELRELVILGDDYFPSSFENKTCDQRLCRSPYKCEKQSLIMKVLKREGNRGISKELPDDLKRQWIVLQKPVTVGCLCIRDYNDRN